MKYCLFDYDEGTVIGLNIGETNIDLNDGWVPIEEEIYDFLLHNNGRYVIDIGNINNKLQTYLNLPIEEKRKSRNIITRKDLMLKPRVDIEITKLNTIRKFKTVCEMYINDGILFEVNGENLHFSYNSIDKQRYAELYNLTKSNISTFPICIDEKESIVFLTKDQFLQLYYQLIYNEYYHLFYFFQLKDYIMNCDDQNQIYRMQYETVLPQERKDIIKQQLNDFLGGGYEVL